MTSFFDDPLDLHVAGGPVRVYRGGSTDAPPLILLHGAMLDTGQGVWRRVAPALAEDHHVHVIDLPRHGGSRPWKGALDSPFFDRFLDSLLDALGIESAAFAGLSMGGGVALSYALARPSRVSALIAVGPGGIGAKRPAQFVTWLTMRIPGVLRLCTWYLAAFPTSIRRTMQTHLVAGAETRDFETIVDLATTEAVAKRKHRERALDDWQVFAYGPFSMRLDLLPSLPNLAVPTLWVRGDRDPLVAQVELVEAHAAAPGSRLVTMPDAGHIVTYDQPERFTAIARDFLRQARDARTDRLDAREEGKRGDITAEGP